MIPDISVVVVSFNTRELLRDCLLTLRKEVEGLANEVFVVDNVSRDGSAEMVAAEFPEARLIRSNVNLGFAAANNKAFSLATGRYIVLLNSDAFLRPMALQRSIEYMDAQPRIGLGGARLVGADGSWQPSRRLFPSPLNDFLSLSGLAAKFPRSRFFGRQDHTWADQDQPGDADWVPGAYSIIRRTVLDQVGHFDEQFFLYYEEVDLCRRIKQAGFLIRYWPDVVVVHLGGESSKTLTNLSMSKSGAQLELWRMRSAFLYYRKHHGPVAWLSKTIEAQWHGLRSWKNSLTPGSVHKTKAEESRLVIQLLRRAWQETAGGAVSPTRPW
ncbi:Glycosyl transferase, family 2 [Acidisarcina polymorpha]|uniref:Glycosyl transferase, family 2 n=1 Tax=Acidisarcina polymorpha TaxID=2211140 RepID=A0A2Z5FTG8_9BACT|nr:glycosyltransferase family 2 protein [Acidisarcina polymorpha]AXC10139.1 Glycosyl transferase, family 2 [Acidisarcina polymorpha]